MDTVYRTGYHFLYYCVSDVDSKCMGVLVNFMYTGDLTVEPGDHLSLYGAAVTLNMPLVQDLLHTYLKGGNTQPKTNTLIKQETVEFHNSSLEQQAHVPVNYQTDQIPHNYDDDGQDGDNYDNDSDYVQETPTRKPRKVKTPKSKSSPKGRKKATPKQTAKSKKTISGSGKRKSKQNGLTPSSTATESPTKRSRKKKSKISLSNSEMQTMIDSQQKAPKVYVPRSKVKVTCVQCYHVCTSHIALNNHMILKHKQCGTNELRNCLVKTSSVRARNIKFVAASVKQETFVSAAEASIKPLPYGCIKCSKTFQFYSKLCFHIQKFHPTHSSRWKHPLRTLSEELTKLVTLVKLRKRPVKCASCSAEFPSDRLLNRHYQREHNATNSLTTLKQSKVTLKVTYECPVCKLLFNERCDLAGHITTVHTDFKSTSCSMCYQVFNTGVEYSNHLVACANKNNKEKKVRITILHLFIYIYLQTGFFPYNWGDP